MPEIRKKMGIVSVSPVLEQKIEEVLMRLPEKVQGFVETQCDFVSVGRETECCGRTVSTKNEYISPWLIILAEDIKEYTIVHEIAHAWSNHDSDLLGTVEDNEKWEKEAHRLTEQWGFKRKS